MIPTRPSALCFDAHFHLQDDRLWPDWKEHWRMARHLGVCGGICCGSSPEDWPRVTEISKESPEIIPAYGVHPWYVHEFKDNWLDELKACLTMGSCVLGEVGLDGRFAQADMTLQMTVLRQQFELAADFSLPVSIHCLDAWLPLLEILDEFPGLSVNMHAFAHSASLDRLLDYGAFFSFNGALTREGHGRMKKALLSCPVERILLETDAPDFPLAQAGLLDKKQINTPSSLPTILQTAADLRQMTRDDLAKQCLKNSQTYLGPKLWEISHG